MNRIDANQIKWRVKELNRMARAAVLSEEDFFWLQGQRLIYELCPSLPTHRLIAELQSTEALKLITGRLTT